MKQLILFILFASLSSLTANISLAKTYTGRLEKTKGRIYLTKNNVKYELQFNAKNLENTVKKLKQKDYLSVEADLIPHPNKSKISKLKINEINYVGLDELLGLWKDEDGVCYFFSGFTKVQLFFPNQIVKCTYSSLNFIELLYPVVYNYFINPNKDDTWNMLLSNDDEQFFGEIEDLSSNQLKKLTIYSADNGDLLLERVMSKVIP